MEVKMNGKTEEWNMQEALVSNTEMKNTGMIGSTCMGYE
jgi:hypothetical protein